MFKITGFVGSLNPLEGKIVCYMQCFLNKTFFMPTDPLDPSASCIHPVTLWLASSKKNFFGLKHLIYINKCQIQCF